MKFNLQRQVDQSVEVLEQHRVRAEDYLWYSKIPTRNTFLDVLDYMQPARTEKQEDMYFSFLISMKQGGENFYSGIIQPQINDKYRFNRKNWNDQFLTK